MLKTLRTGALSALAALTLLGGCQGGGTDLGGGDTAGGGEDLEKRTSAFTQDELNFFKQAGDIIGVAKDISGAYSGITGAFAVGTKVLQVLGLLAPSGPSLPQQIAALQATINKLVVDNNMNAAALDWKLMALFNNSIHWAPVEAALNEIRQRDIRGGNLIPRDSAWNSGSATALVAAGGQVMFERKFDELATDGAWKYIIYSKQPDLLDVDQVFDWRLGLPWYSQLIGMRLAIMAAVDPNFARTNSFFAELEEMRNNLIRVRDQMISANIRCEAHDRGHDRVSLFDIGPASPSLPPVPGIPLESGTYIACADVNTGISVVKVITDGNYPAGARGTSYPCVQCSMSGCGYSPSSCFNNWPGRDALIERTRQELLDLLPLSEIQAMIDVLYRYRHPEVLDLAEHTTQEIAFGGAGGGCLDASPPPAKYPAATSGAFAGEWGWDPTGTPVWVKNCNGSSAQRWEYDRRSGRIRNPALNKCLEIAPSRMIRTLSTNPVPNAFDDKITAQDTLLSGAYAAVGNCAVDSPSLANPMPPTQQWSYDQATKLLRGGYNTALRLMRTTTLDRGYPVAATAVAWGGSGDQRWAADQPHVLVTGIGNGGDIQALTLNNDRASTLAARQDHVSKAWYVGAALPAPDGLKLSALAAGNGNGGSLQVLGVGTEDHFAYLSSWQDGGGGWHPGFLLPDQTTKLSALATAFGAGSLQVLGLGAADGRTYLASWQDSGGNWHPGFQLPGQNTPFSALATAIGGGLVQVLGLGAADGHAYLASWQEGNGVWHSGFQLPGQNVAFSAITTGIGSGLVHVLGLGAADGRPYLASWQDGGGVWYSGFQLPSPATRMSAIAAENGYGNVLHVIGLGAADGMAYVASWRDTDGFWHAGTALPSPGVPMSSLALSRDSAGNLQVSGIGLYDGKAYLVSRQSSGVWYSGGVIN